MKQEKKIPSILGLFLLIAGTFTGVYLNRSTLLFRSKASLPCNPVNPQVTNITHQSFDLSFTTVSNCSSSVSVSNRTIENNHPSSSAHYFHIHDLEENQNYQFSIILDGTTFQRPEYQIKTASLPSGPIPASNLAWGKVLKQDQSPAVGAIIYLNIPGATPLSSQVTSSGNWDISLAISLDQSKQNWFSPPPNIEEEIIVISSSGQITQIDGNTSSNNPVPDIIIGQASADISPQPTTGQTNLPSTDSSPSSSQDQSLKINNPQDNESVFTQTPEFFGTGPKNSQIIITVNSPQTIEGLTTTSSQGDWSWLPPQNLSPGNHSITVKTKDPQTDLWQTVTHNFIVYASDDDSLSFSSSPSATINTPSPSPTTAISASPSPTIAISLVPTTTPTLSPTIQPTVRSAKPATDSGVPVSGFGIPTILSLLFAFILIVSGYFLLI